MDFTTKELVRKVCQVIMDNGTATMYYYKGVSEKPEPMYDMDGGLYHAQEDEEEEADRFVIEFDDIEVHIHLDEDDGNSLTMFLFNHVDCSVDGAIANVALEEKVIHRAYTALMGSHFMKSFDNDWNGHSIEEDM